MACSELRVTGEFVDVNERQEEEKKKMIMKVRRTPGERAAMESLLKKAEWWLDRNLQEMPLMGDGKLRKEGENHVLQWVIEKLKEEVGS